MGCEWRANVVPALLTAAGTRLEASIREAFVGLGREIGYCIASRINIRTLIEYTHAFRFA